MSKKSQLSFLIVQPWISYRGAESVSVFEAYSLQKLGYRVAIACLYIDRSRLPLYGNSVDYILPPFLLSVLLRKSKLLFLLFGFPTLFFLVYFSARRFTVLNPHNMPSQIVCALISLLFQCKVLWTSHGVPASANIFSGLFDRAAWILGSSWIDRWSVRRMTYVVAVSKKVSHEISIHYGVPSVVIYPPVASEFYSRGEGAKVRRKLFISDDTFVILHLSRLHPAKEPEVSLLAFAEFAHSVSKVALFFVGEGISLDALRKKAIELGIADKVFFVGFVPPNETHDYYAAADVVSLPYWRSEGCSLTAFEALAAGALPVVARDCGADELIGKYNLGIISDSKVRDFARAFLRSYKERRSWKRKVGARRAVIAEMLSGSNYAKQIIYALGEYV